MGRFQPFDYVAFAQTSDLAGDGNGRPGQASAGDGARQDDMRTFRQLDRNGYATVLAYTVGGRLDTVTDEAGRTLSYRYTPEGRIASITDPLGRSVAYGYDARGDLTTVTDVGGGVTSYGYDSRHRIVSMRNPRGKETTNRYDGEDRVTAQSDPEDKITTSWPNATPASDSPPAGHFSSGSKNLKTV